MPDEIPYASGPLRNWPLTEEALDQAMQKHAEESGRTDMDEVFREEVLAYVRPTYEVLNRQIITDLNLQLPGGASLEDQQQIREKADAEITRTVASFREMIAGVFGQTVRAAIELVTLRRRLRALGEDI